MAPKIKHPYVPDEPDVLVSCRICKVSYPKTIEYFSQYLIRKGKDEIQRNFRKVCRSCYTWQIRRWYYDNPERAKEIARENNRRNPENVQRSYRKRRARKMEVLHEPYTDQEVLNLYGTKCWICTEEIDMSAPRACGRDGWERGLQFDHVMPLAIGGEDTIRNVRPSHGYCNKSRPHDGSDLV